MDKDQKIAELLKINAELQKQVEQQAEIIKLLQNRIFGKKTEKLDKNQLSLFREEDLESLVVEKDSRKKEAKIKNKLSRVRHCKAKSNGCRAEFLDNLEQVTVVHDLAKQTCKECCHKLKPIGKRLAYREAVLKPAELICHNHYQTTYKCNHCHPKGGDKIIMAIPDRAPIFPHSYYSASVLSEIILDKYELALPLHRQCLKFNSIGLPLNTKQISRAVIELSKKLEDVYDYLTQKLLVNPVIHMDETPFRVLAEKERVTSYFWVMRTTKEFANHQIAVFRYSNNRRQENIQNLVGDFKNAIMCDGYTGYSDKKYPQIDFGACLVHIRRKFVEIVKILKHGHSSTALKAVELLNKIFDKEDKLIYTTATEKAQKRLKYVKPYVDKFYEFLDGIQNPGGKLKQAIHYAKNARERLEKIYKIGEMPLSNNPVEQTIRPATLVRKNSLFAKSVAGAKANAIFHTLIETAKLNGLNASKYFNHIISLLELRKTVEIEAYLPWNPEIQAKCAK